MTNNTAVTPTEDLRKSDLEHYDKVAIAGHHHHSSIPKAIDYYWDMHSDQHLTQLNIEDEGFAYDENYKEFVEKKHHTSVFHKDVNHRGAERTLMLLYNNVSHWLLLSVSDGKPAYMAEKMFDKDEKGELSIPIITIAAGNTVFAGTVKNKSELKKVLSQININ